MLTLDPAPPGDKAWTRLLPADLRVQLAARLDAAPLPPFTAVARLFGEPVGVAAAAALDAGTGELLLVEVTPKLRRRGLGGRLLAACEAAARRAGLRHLTCHWSTEGRDDPASLGGFLAASGWTEAAEAGRAVRMPAAGAASYLRRLAVRLPPTPLHAVIPWTDVTPVQREVLARRLAHQPVAPALDPFALEPLNDPAHCRALVAGGEVLAWFMARRTAPQRLWIAGSYALPEALDAACTLPLWADALEAAEAERPGTLVAWDTPLSQMPMSRFLARREAGSDAHVATRWQAVRCLPLSIGETA